MATTPIEARFWAKVNKTDGCWIWTAYRTPKGYGRFNDGTRIVFAHRWAYENQIGHVPEGRQLDHLCRVRDCVNPAHLEPVTARENNARGQSVTAAHVAKTHCINGHEFTAENTKFGLNGRRYCRACSRIFNRKRRARRRAAR